MIEQFQIHIDRLNLRGKRLLVAVSGGLDSIVMSHLLWKLGLNVALAHCNFSLRGQESDDDENFVKKWGNSLGVPLHTIRFATKAYAQQHGLNTQLAARELRYNWFEELCHKFDYQNIVTAHHADDVWETFLINLSRGSGLRGLCSIPEHNNLIIRPLLPFARKDIQQYATENNLLWRNDSSNDSDCYVRNRIRHHISPLMEELHPQFWKNFKQSISFLNQTQNFLNQTIEQLKTNIFEDKSSHISINIEQLKSIPNFDFVLFQWLLPYGFTNTTDVKNIIEANTGKYILSTTHRLLKNRNHLIINEIKHEKEEEYLITDGEKYIDTPIKMALEIVDNINIKNIKTIHLDANTLHFPLTIRRKKKGDFFYPDGMKGKKKISKFFKDEKYSIFDKEQIWLLCSSDDIVWVIGKRADTRYVATEDTKKIIRLSILD